MMNKEPRHHILRDGHSTKKSQHRNNNPALIMKNKELLEILEALENLLVPLSYIPSFWLQHKILVPRWLS